MISTIYIHMRVYKKEPIIKSNWIYHKETIINKSYKIVSY